MNHSSVPTIPLTLRGKGIRYRKYPVNPEFECSLHPGMIQQLATDASAFLVTPKEPKDFWLRVLVDSLRTRSQFVFTTSLPRQAGDENDKAVARTLFQLDGDVLLKINEGLLTRTDGISVLEAHFGWTEWCLQELGRALLLPHRLRSIAKLSLVFGTLAFAWGLAPAMGLGVSSAGVYLQALGLAMLMPVHLFLSPSILRYFCWFPPLIGACCSCSFMFGLVPGAATAWHVNILPLLLGLASGPFGGRLLWPLAWRITTHILR